MLFRWKDVYRGLILSNLVNAGKSTRLMLIECGNLESHQVMEINATSYLYFKQGTPLRLGKNRWQFVFTARTIDQIRSFVSNKPTALALLCCPRRFNPEKIVIAFIHPTELANMLKLDSSNQQIINVQYLKGRIRVIGSVSFGSRPEYLVKRNEIQHWGI